MPRKTIKAKVGRTAPGAFPAFEELNQFDQLDLELPNDREDPDRVLTGFRCTIRQWLASAPGKAWVAEYQRKFRVLPTIVKMTQARKETT